MSSAKRAAITNEDTWRYGGVGPAWPFELNLAALLVMKDVIETMEEIASGEDDKTSRNRILSEVRGMLGESSSRRWWRW